MTIFLVSALAVARAANTSSATDLAGAAGTPQPTEAKKRMAIRLAGLVAFVAGSCHALTPNYGRFKAVIHLLGVTPEDLAAPDVRASYIGYTLKYQAESKASRDRARLEFGPSGTRVPGLFSIVQ
jgi:hypothetical protein